MHILSAIMLFIITLSVSVTAWAEETAEEKNGAAAEQTESANPKTAPSPDPKPETKPADTAAEPGC